jgi:uncharacterized membrane protein YeaQ/YmgE (transglycosylase-associated protein family)
MKNLQELKRSTNIGWLLTAIVLAVLGAVVGYLEAPLLKHSSWVCAVLGALICIMFIACLFLADRYRL